VPGCWSWILFVLPISLLPTRVLSLGWLKSVISLTSTLNSPVKTLVSIGDSVVRLLPLSQVKSAKANGSGAFGLAGTLALAASRPGAVRTVVGSGWPWLCAKRTCGTCGGGG